MILPIGASSFREALRMGAEVFHALKKQINQQGMSTAVGDEGGFAPNVPNHEAAIQLILQAIAEAGYEAGSQIALGLDCASSEFYRDGRSEEHTSELQSLMRISYAVFCLKKKQQTNKIIILYTLSQVIM